MNDLMSGTMHRFWKDQFVRMAGPIASRGARECDGGGGG
jgi:ubiquinone/menaquinone biosynthesis C-methylase UbiE